MTLVRRQVRPERDLHRQVVLLDVDQRQHRQRPRVVMNRPHSVRPSHQRSYAWFTRNPSAVQQPPAGPAAARRRLRARGGVGRRHGTRNTGAARGRSERAQKTRGLSPVSGGVGRGPRLRSLVPRQPSPAAHRSRRGQGSGCPGGEGATCRGQSGPCPGRWGSKVGDHTIRNLGGADLSPHTSLTALLALGAFRGPPPRPRPAPPAPPTPPGTPPRGSWSSAWRGRAWRS